MSRLAIAVWGLQTLAAPASAHGGLDGGGAPAAFAVVVGLPLVGGLLGGFGTIRHRRRCHHADDRPRVRAALALVVVVLGGTLVFAALRTSPPVAIAGGLLGATAATWLTRRGRPAGADEQGHATLTLGAIALHRLVEGTVLGALYSAGAVVGLVGAVALAGHTAVETAAVGGLYGTRRGKAVGAVVLVQASHVAGAMAGLASAATSPAPVRLAVLALIGGALLVTGAIEWNRALASGRGRGPRTAQNHGP